MTGTEVAASEASKLQLLASEVFVVAATAMTLVAAVETSFGVGACHRECLPIPGNAIFRFGRRRFEPQNV